MNTQLTDHLTKNFRLSFEHDPKVIVRAPGRVNLIGEHTDYNGGFVLPCAIGLETQIAATPRPDRLVRVVAVDQNNDFDQFDLAQSIVQHPQKQWVNYVRGVFKVLQDHGHNIGGANLTIAGTVPQGAGLSSSAALCVAVALVLKHLTAMPNMEATELAHIAQDAESNFVGCKCGIMDQLVSTHGIDDHAVLIDCANLATEAIAVPDDLAIMIVHSGISRGLVDGAYNQRRMQCEQAAAQLGVAQLRDATEEQLSRYQPKMDHTIFRRARHVITENTRTLKAAQALKKGDMASLRTLMAASHESMRQDFEITVPGIDQLVHVVQSVLGEIGGARMTGGGFGGAVVAILPHGECSRVADFIRAGYQTPAGTLPDVMIEKPAAGACIVETTT